MFLGPGEALWSIVKYQESKKAKSKMFDKLS